MFAALATSAGTVAFTLPTLVVAHPWLGLRTPPADVASRLVEGFARCGRLAGFLAPVMLFFVASASATRALYVIAILGLGAVWLTASGLEIVDAEGDSPRAPVAALVATAWTALAALVGAVLLFGVL